MTDNNVDLGNLKSRDVGNLISKQLVEMGKDEIRQGAPEDSVDYGNLPSKTLPQLGKKVVANAVQQEKATLR